MPKKILITGATSGIGYESAKLFAAQGHHLLVHGRDRAKVEALERELRMISGANGVEGYVADLSRWEDIETLATQITAKHKELFALINNAGVFKTSPAHTPQGHDLRFMVNTFAPFLLTQRLLPLLGRLGRVINLSSAAQRSVDLDALAGRKRLEDFEAYAQSKLATTAWSRWLARKSPEGPAVIAINPGSMLGTNMVREGFGVRGNDVLIGAKAIVKATLSEEFAQASGQYYDQDAQRFARPHQDVLDDKKIASIVQAIEDELVNKRA